MTDLVIFDIDGTLASCKWRDSLAKAKRWDEYHCGIPYDSPIDENVAALRDWHERGVRLVFITGRMASRSVSHHTDLWFRNHILPMGMFIFRKPDDFRPASVVKADALAYLQQYSGVNVVCAYEDNRHCVDMFRSKSIVTVKCHDPGTAPTFGTVQLMLEWLDERLRD